MKKHPLQAASLPPFSTLDSPMSVIRATTLGIALLLTSCASHGRGSYFDSGIHQYTGDGSIQDISDSSGAFPSHGFLITFPKFSLDKSYVHVFRLAGLPIIKENEIGVYFLVAESLKQAQVGNSGASISMSVLDGKGEKVSSGEGTLAEFIWASPMHGYRGHALYQAGRSFFSPIPNESYSLRVSYSQGTATVHSEAQVYLWCAVGGS